MEPLPLRFVRCVDCGHIFNAAFDYEKVPYFNKPNLMFNRGQLWSGFVENAIEVLQGKIPTDPTVVEIGHGDGGFLRSIARKTSRGRFVGFDPYGIGDEDEFVTFRKSMFEPELHLPELRPDLIITRHVLEHMANPLGFLQKIHFVSGMLDIQPVIYIEVPCVDRLLETSRTVDLYYEHSSQFTSKSFVRMLECSGGKVEFVKHGYHGEIIYATLRMIGDSGHLEVVRTAKKYRAETEHSRNIIQSQLRDLCDSGKRIAVWGGTGKSAAFMNRYGLDAIRFPVVVDSDMDKVGTYVPGTGQEIQFRDLLKTKEVDIIIVPAQWRAADILGEIEQQEIVVETILIEHEGKLIDFRLSDNPYR